MEKIDFLRQEIDVLDKELIDILSKRLKVVNKIGNLKKQLKMPALQAKRWQEVIKSSKKTVRKLKLNEDFIENIFNQIHKEALRIEKFIT